MRICFVILTCEKYLSTRVPWQRCTSLKGVNSEDIVYLGHTMDVRQRLFSWGAKDDYRSLPFKFLDFFRFFVPNKEYDWYMLIDDDTYVYVDRLREHLKKMDASTLRVEGHLLTHLAHTEWGVYPSGGAGTVLSVATVMAIRELFTKLSPLQWIRHWCADICLGLWVKAIRGTQMIHHIGFHPKEWENEDRSTAITFHNIRTEEDYVLLLEEPSCPV